MVAIPAALAWSAGTAHADWSGDGRADVLAIDPAERLLLYRGDGAGGWLTATGEPIGIGWGAFTALLSPGDFSGDGKPDLLVRRADGALLLYRGNGAGGWLTGRGGKRRVDRSPPYVVRLRVDRPPRTRGRAYARVAYRREGSRQVRHKTVSRRFVMCR